MRKILLLTLLGLPVPASANIGLPMVAIFLPPMWLGLIAIIAIEALILARLLDTTFRRTLLPVTVGNIVSTIVGIPLVWFLLAIVEMVCCGTAKGLATVGTKIYAVTAQASWLIPYEDEFHWMIPAALATLLVPFLAASVAIEAPFNKWLLTDATGRIWRATTLANIASYACLALLLVLYFALGEQLAVVGGFFMPVIDAMVDAVFVIAKMFSSQ